MGIKVSPNISNGFNSDLGNFKGKFQVFLNVISHRCHEHNFVRLSYAPGIHFTQAHKLAKGAKHRLNRTLTFLFHIPTLTAFYPFYGTFVFWFIIGYRYSFFITFAFTGCGISTIKRTGKGNKTKYRVDVVIEGFEPRPQYHQ